MSYDNLLTHELAVLRPTQVADRAGTLLPDHTQATTVAVVRGFVQQRQPGRENTDLRQASIATFTVFLPAGVDVTVGDRLRWGGRTLEVTGPPADKYRPGQLHHLTLPAREVIG